MRQLSLLYTGNQQCYNVKYSPFDNSLLACVSCDKFGISGGASIFFMRHEESAFLDSKFSIVESYKANHTLFDLDWSPQDPTLLLTGNGDGSVSLWKYDINNNNNVRRPTFTTRNHAKEVYSVMWEPSGMRSYHFLSAAWDNSIRIWNVSNTGLTELTSLNGHESIVYTGSWHPKRAGILLSGSADKSFRIWDVNSSSINSTPIFISRPNQSDVLSCDWNRFDPNIFVIGYASGLIEIRDFRNLNAPPLRSIDMAHSYAIKKIKFSPHFKNVFGSVSYDMNTKLWNLENGLIEESKNHSEFAYGFDFDPKLPNRLVDCGWDRRVIISEFELNNRFN